MKVTLDKGAFMPTKAHDADAGYDLYLPDREDAAPVMLPDGKTVVIDTGVHIALPKGYAAVCMNKSGLSVNHGIESVLGLIDSGYTGPIKVKLRNTSNKPYIFEAGNKISQLVIFPISDETLEITNELEDTERGNRGFGSTGA